MAPITMDAVLLDLDGVLVDTEPLHEQIELQLFRDQGIDVAPHFLATLKGLPEEQVVKGVQLHYKKSVNLDLFAKGRKQLFMKAVKERKVKPYPLTTAALKRLKTWGCKLAVVSSSPAWLVSAVLQSVEIEQFFQVRVTSNDCIRKKPHPDPYVQAMKMLGAGKHATVIVEDSHNGLAAAVAAKPKCVVGLTTTLPLEVVRNYTKYVYPTLWEAVSQMISLWSKNCDAT